jgi:hypothetical protein
MPASAAKCRGCGGQGNNPRSERCLDHSEANADRAGELDAELRQLGTSAKKDSAKNAPVGNDGDVDSGKHPGAADPDLAVLDWPPARLGFEYNDRTNATLPGGCLVVELEPNWPALRSESRRFEGPTNGTCKFLRRRTNLPAVADWEDVVG